MNEEEELHQDAKILSMSLDWWKREANVMIGKIEVLEERLYDGTATKRDREQHDDLVKEINLLVARGRLENRNLEEMEEKIRRFQKIEKDHDDTREA